MKIKRLPIINKILQWIKNLYNKKYSDQRWMEGITSYIHYDVTEKDLQELEKIINDFKKEHNIT